MKIRDRIKLTRFGRATSTGATSKATPQALNPVFAYERDGHRWTFEDGHILIDGYDVAPVINQEEPSISTLAGLASGLDEYKRHNERFAWKRPAIGKLLAVVDALIERILGRLKRIYDDKIFGVSWKLKGDDFIVNGVNVHAFLAMYRVRKTDKSHRFLVGLHHKIERLIANPSGNWRNERARTALLRLRHEINQELHHAPPSAFDQPLLHAGDMAC